MDGGWTAHENENEKNGPKNVRSKQPGYEDLFSIFFFCS